MSINVDIGSYKTCGQIETDSVTEKQYSFRTLVSLEENLVGSDVFALQDLITPIVPMQNGIVTDWEATEKIYQHLFAKLGLDDTFLPLIVCEQPYFSCKKNRVDHLSYLAESYDIPRFLFINSALLSLYTVMKVSGVVVSMGHDSTIVSPIFCSSVLPSHKIPIGGQQMVDLLQYNLLNRGVKVDTETARDIVHSNCQFLHSRVVPILDEEVTTKYELPDHNILTLTASEVYDTPEILFDANLLPNKLKHLWNIQDCSSLRQSIDDLIELCSDDVRKSVESNILICGGPAQTLHMPTRAYAELPTSKVKVGSDATALTGAAMIGSIANHVDHYWITKQDCHEYGSSIVYRKGLFE